MQDATHLRVKAGVTLALLLAGGFCASLPAHAQTTIDTTPTWIANGSQSTGFWGEPDTATYGQSFIAPTGVTSLNDFSFYLTTYSDGVTTSASSVPYQAYVYAWDGSQATGSALYSSAALNTGALVTNNFTTITTNTGTLAVTPGQQYVAFLSTSAVQDGSTKLANFGDVGGSAGTGGSFVYLSSGNTPALFTTPGWGAIAGDDLAFKADFTSGSTVAPELSPAVTVTFVIFGISLLLAKKAVKRKAAEAA